MRSVEMALGFARGIPGFMLPSHTAADSDDAISLLRYGYMIQQADEPKPQYRPKWLWSLVSKIALRYWRWKYKGLPEARVREWFESCKNYQAINRLERWNTGGRAVPRSASHERTSDPHFASDPNSNTDPAGEEHTLTPIDVYRLGVSSTIQPRKNLKQ